MALYRVTDGRHEDLDLMTAATTAGGQVVKDLVGVGAADNATQAVIHRIKTVQGELADLGTRTTARATTT